MKFTLQKTSFLFLTGLLIFVYIFPRGLTKILGQEHFLSSWLYIYTLGLIFFIVNIRFLLKSKAIRLDRAGEKKWFLLFIFGLLCTLSFHGVWILTAVILPFKG